jgi:hypothetical protein
MLLAVARLVVGGVLGGWWLHRRAAVLGRSAASGCQGCARRLRSGKRLRRIAVTVAVAAGALGLAVSLRPDVAVCPAVRPARPLPDTLLARARQSINATATGVGASYGALQHGERCRGPRPQVSLVRQGYPAVGSWSASCLLRHRGPRRTARP